jgi:hypothetical protein
MVCHIIPPLLVNFSGFSFVDSRNIEVRDNIKATDDYIHIISCSIPDILASLSEK